MARITSNRRIFLVNLIVGIALQVSLFPFGGQAAAKPAGMRTAIEMLDKRTPAARAVGTVAISASPGR